MSEVPIKHDRELKWIPIDRIIKNERNPRRKEHFAPEQLSMLRNSMETHGVLEPIIVCPYDDDLYILLEGERRWTSAKLLGMKEVPAVIVNRMNEHDQVLVMFNIHTNRRGWEMAEELASIKELKQRNGHLSDRELARELGMSEQLLRERLIVLNMGDAVVAQIGKGEIDYTSALRTRQVVKRIKRSRPQVVDDLGGEIAVERKLLRKAKERGGISQELVEASRDLADPSALSDRAVISYIDEPRTTIRDVRSKELEDQRMIDDLSKEMNRIEREIRGFNVDLESAPNLKRLRGALASLIDAAESLEARVVESLHGLRTEPEA